MFDWRITSVRGGIVGVVVALFLMSALLLWFLGYVNHADWNKKAVQSSCLIKDHQIVDDTCSYSCNCHQTCHSTTDTQSCSTTCSTCYYQCYEGMILVEYQYAEKTYDNSVLVIGDRDSVASVIASLQVFLTIPAAFRICMICGQS
jgi:hypothetical protein